MNDLDRVARLLFIAKGRVLDATLIASASDDERLFDAAPRCLRVLILIDKLHEELRTTPPEPSQPMRRKAKKPSGGASRRTETTPPDLDSGNGVHRPPVEPSRLPH